MDTLAEIRTAVKSDLNIGDNSSLYPQATIDRAINRSRIKCEGLFPWPALEDAQETTSQTNQNYYEAPSNWFPQSIWRLTVNGVQYGEDPDGSPLNYRDYLKWKEDFPTSTEKKWSVQWLRYFITPTPTVNTDTICIWGLKRGTALSNDADRTIFSGSLPDGNEAIALEAVAILKKKGQSIPGSQFYSNDAKQILIIAYDQIKQQKSKEDRNLPFFNVPDYYHDNNAPQITGNFYSGREIL